MFLHFMKLLQRRVNRFAGLHGLIYMDNEMQGRIMQLESEIIQQFLFPGT